MHLCIKCEMREGAMSRDRLCCQCRGHTIMPQCLCGNMKPNKKSICKKCCRQERWRQGIRDRERLEFVHAFYTEIERRLHLSIECTQRTRMHHEIQRLDSSSNTIFS